MFDFAKVFTENPHGVFATRDGEAVRTRVFQFLFAEGKKVYFGTGGGKDVCAQITANPNVSYCAFPADFSPVVSVDGKVVFVDDLALKARAFEASPVVKEIYKTPDNPGFRMFYIDVETAHTFSFAEGTKAYQL